MNILVFAAHPDDAEIGMGGTIARLAALGHSVLICDLTDGSPTPRGDRESRIREAAEALERLQPAGRGVPIRRVMLDLKNREVQHTIEARHKAAGVIRAHQARMVFAPHWEDAHPDHVASARLCEDARFDAKLTKVEMPVPPGMQPGAPIYPRWFFHYDISHLRGVFNPSFCFDITGFEAAKQASIRAYRSQFGPWDDAAPAFAQGDPKAQRGAPPSDPALLVSADFPQRMVAIAAYWGSVAGVPYAEPFFSREPLALGSLEGVV